MGCVSILDGIAEIVGGVVRDEHRHLRLRERVASEVGTAVGSGILQ